jgi:hypothetical protein
MFDFISGRIDEGSGDVNKKRVKVFCLTNEDEKEGYEDLLNNPDKTIIEETPPTLDRVGRVIVIVKWEEPI